MHQPYCHTHTLQQKTKQQQYGIVAKRMIQNSKNADNDLRSNVQDSHAQNVSFVYALINNVLGIYENCVDIRSTENLAVIVKDGYPFQGGQRWLAMHKRGNQPLCWAEQTKMLGCNSYVVLNNSQNRCQKIPTSCKNV